MRCGKIEIKRIENSTSRHVTFLKHRNEFIKEAREISMLFDFDIAIIVFSRAGKISGFCSTRTTLLKMLEKYQQHSGKKLLDTKHELIRHLKGKDLNSLNPRDLISIEDALQNGITIVCSKKMEFFKMLNLNLEEDVVREAQDINLFTESMQMNMEMMKNGCGMQCQRGQGGRLRSFIRFISNNTNDHYSETNGWTSKLAEARYNEMIALQKWQEDLDEAKH